MEPQEILANVQQALQNDPTLTREDIDEYIREETGGKYSSIPALQSAVKPVGGLEAATRGFTEVATFGFDDEIIGALRSVFGDEDMADEIEYERERRKRAGEQQKWARRGGMAAGMLVPGMGSMKAMRGARTLPGLIGRGAGVGAVEGAAAGVGHGEDPGQRAVSGLLGAAGGTAIGAAMPPAIAAAPGAVRGVARRLLPDDLLERIARRTPKSLQRAGMGTTEVAADRRLVHSMEQQAGGPRVSRPPITPEQGAARASELYGPEAVGADIGPRMNAELRRAAAASPELGEDIVATLAERSAGTPGRLTGRLGGAEARQGNRWLDFMHTPEESQRISREIFGEIDDQFATFKIPGRENEAIQDLLDQAADFRPELLQMPLFQRLIKKRAINRDFLTFGDMQALRHRLQGQAGVLRRAGDDASANDIGKIIDDFQGSLEAVVPGLRKANMEWRAIRGGQEALENGIKLRTSKATAQEIEAAIVEAGRRSGGGPEGQRSQTLLKRAYLGQLAQEISADKSLKLSISDRDALARIFPNETTVNRFIKQILGEQEGDALLASVRSATKAATEAESKRAVIPRISAYVRGAIAQVLSLLVHGVSEGQARRISIRGGQKLMRSPQEVTGLLNQPMAGQFGGMMQAAPAAASLPMLAQFPPMLAMSMMGRGGGGSDQ